ncbi:hypothetical protein [Lysobacter gummosus]|uniref:hypothetical protein n=1 Tax=Lysobacter gummosus TaxID=262324 RepID=UPI00362B71AA
MAVSVIDSRIKSATLSSPSAEKYSFNHSGSFLWASICSLKYWPCVAGSPEPQRWSWIIDTAAS